MKLVHYTTMSCYGQKTNQLTKANDIYTDTDIEITSWDCYNNTC